MNKSVYFHELCTEYEAELDDLGTDSEGRNVLDKRLTQKRKAFASLLPMVGMAPVMVAPVLHRAFGFHNVPRGLMEAVMEGEPGDFPSWAEVAAGVGLAEWAVPYVNAALAEPGGEDFLVTTVGLEYALRAARHAPVGGTEDGVERERDEGERDEDEDTEGLGEDFLEQQGFDRRTKE
ncbi:MAG: hypothetical protein ACOYLX_03810 [Burkholderiaceae bacterium]|jgi:hypothetical protein